MYIDKGLSCCVSSILHESSSFCCIEISQHSSTTLMRQILFTCRAAHVNYFVQDSKHNNLTTDWHAITLLGTRLLYESFTWKSVSTTNLNCYFPFVLHFQIRVIRLCRSGQLNLYYYAICVTLEFFMLTYLFTCCRHKGATWFICISRR